MRAGASALLFLATVAVALSPGCVGYDTLLVPNRIRLSPSITTAAPGEVIEYQAKGFSRVGIEVPLPEQAVDWALHAAPLPEDIPAPEGIHDEEAPGFIDFSGRVEASPLVQPGHYRTGIIEAAGWGEYENLTAVAYVIVDGNIRLDAPRLEVWPQDLRVPLGAVVPFVILSTEPRSGRVSRAPNLVWSLPEGPGTISADTGVYQAPAALSDSQPEEAQVLAISSEGRRASAYLTLDPEAARKVEELHLVPEGTLKVALGRSQRFMLYGTDRDERYIPMPDAEWLVEGGIGTLTEHGDGTVEFLARAAGAGALVAARSDKLLRREIVSVVPGV